MKTTMVKIIYKTPTGKLMMWGCSEKLVDKYIQQCEDKGFEIIDLEFE